MIVFAMVDQRRSAKDDGPTNRLAVIGPNNGSPSGLKPGLIGECFAETTNDNKLNIRNRTLVKVDQYLYFSKTPENFAARD